MGLYIPDMRLPSDGDFELWIAVRKDGSFTYNVSGGWQDGKQKAVPVPPHGRLIDADAFLALINDSTILSDFLKWIINPLIRGEPTIIPAEDEHTMEEFMYGQEGNPHDGSM